MAAEIRVRIHAHHTKPHQSTMEQQQSLTSRIKINHLISGLWRRTASRRGR